MITIKHLRIFMEVCRTESMSRAASSLFISQPTISQKISDIEEYYHIKLFERFSKSLKITEEGKEFYQYARRVLDEMDRLDATFLRHDEIVHLRLGATMTVGSSFFPHLIKEVGKKLEKVNLTGYVDNTSSIETKLLNNELDLGIVEGIITSPNIVSEPIISDCLVLICGNAHSFAKMPVVHKEDLANQSFIMRELGSGTRSMFSLFMETQRIPYRISWECHSWDAIKQAVIANLGLAIISVRLIEKELDNGQIHIIDMEDCMWRRMFSLCYHKNKSWSDPLKNLRQEIRNYAQSEKVCPANELIKHVLDI